jgi:ParB family chromosome partitioning protein
MTPSALTPVAAVEALPAVLARAAATLAGATGAAAVLEAREQAGAVYDAARRAERLAAAVNAHDDLVERARRMQADALLIELRAKTRLADEYDHAQARGELASPGRPKNARDAGDFPGAAPAGVDTRRMAEYRRLRDAVAAQPGVVERAVTALLDEGEQITRAAIWRAVDPHVAHNSGNNEWYTPREYIEAARAVMGGIDLDPASCETAQRTVQATRYFSAADNGLAHEWHGRIWLNPPYAQPLISQFVAKLVAEHAAGRVTQACVLVNNGTDTAWGQALLGAASAVCFPAGRIRFIDADGNPSGAPLQGQMVCYLGMAPGGFIKAWGGCGSAMVPQAQRREVQT